MENMVERMTWAFKDKLVILAEKFVAGQHFTIIAGLGRLEDATTAYVANNLPKKYPSAS